MFLYITDGAGHTNLSNTPTPLGLYDVLLARPDAPAMELRAAPDTSLNYLSFYLPRFLQ